jgi:hypothetical protein
MSEGRQFLNPCLFRDVVYLCGGYDTGSIEAFDLLRQLFLPWKVQLPEKQALCVWVDKGLICLQSRSFSLKYRVNDKGSLQEIQRIQLSEYSYKYQNSQPVYDPIRNRVYFLFEGQVSYVLSTPTAS